MNINWFPGHMTKSLRMMEIEVKNVDIIIYLLDARAPMSSFNPKFKKLTADKAVLYVLNKYDLADDKKTEKFIEMLKNDGFEAIKCNAAVSGASKIIEPILKTLSSKKIEKFGAKGITMLPKAMVIGVPNVGKSTLINNLVGKAKTLTGNKPGVTKGKQTITLESGIQLVDTPGTLWPSFENEKTAKNLAIIGSIKDTVVDINELAFYLANFLKQNYPDSLFIRYGVKNANDTYDLICQIGEKRGYLLKGGEVDLDRTCQMMLTEFRKGVIGKITLD